MGLSGLYCDERCLKDETIFIKKVELSINSTLLIVKVVILNSFFKLVFCLLNITNLSASSKLLILAVLQSRTFLRFLAVNECFSYR